LRQKGQRRISKRSIRGANLPPEGSRALRPHTVHTDPPLTLEPVTVAVAALAALPASLLSIWGLLHTSAARHVVAAPRADRWHTRSTPLLGGSGIFAGLLVAVGVGLATGEVHATAKLGGILGGCAILFVAGLLDDVFSLGPITKLVGQGAATALVLVSGVRVEIIGNDVLATILGVVWLVGLTNAFNLLDNMD